MNLMLHAQEYAIQAGSQLVAVFCDSSDVLAVHEMVSKLVLATLGNESLVNLEVSLGCVVVYITFNQGGLNTEGLADGLKAEGAHLTLVIDPEGHTGFLASERLQGAPTMTVFCATCLSVASHVWLFREVCYV